MLKVNKNNWKWIVFFLVVALTYLLLDILDVAGIPRQILILPVCFIVQYLLAKVFGIRVPSGLSDVDVPAKIGIFYRFCAFGIVLGAIVVPIYLYRRRKKKIYLILSGIAVAWIIVSFCFFFFIVLSMMEIMD